MDSGCEEILEICFDNVPCGVGSVETVEVVVDCACGDVVAAVEDQPIVLSILSIIIVTDQRSSLPRLYLLTLLLDHLYTLILEIHPPQNIRVLQQLSIHTAKQVHNVSIIIPCPLLATSNILQMIGVV